MKRTYVILDDDLAFTMLLKKQLEHFNDLECLDTYDNTIKAANGITKLKPDILFLDMEIDSLNGLEVLEVLDHSPKTIVISSHEGFVQDALQFKVYDYIKKPQLSVNRLQNAIAKVS